MILRLLSGPVAGAFVSLFTMISTSPAAVGPFEGYGAISVGGAGGQVYHVTSLADSGPGTLRDAVLNRTGPRVVVFDVAGTITLMSDIAIKMPYLTIDGSTAPSPGITIRQNTIYDEFLICGTHDIIITHLRFWGLWERGGVHSNNAATINIDGDTGPDHVAQRIVLDHIVGRNSTDGGPDIWGEVRDVTISWSMFYYNWHPTTVSHYPGPYQVRQRISMHHNVYAKNGERNPQLRADVRNFDFRNNIIYDWGFFGENSGCGIRIKNSATEPKVHANLINNYFLPTIRPNQSLVYGSGPGADSEDGGPSSVVPQGTLVTTSKMGQLYVAGNILPPENKDHYSTIAAPLAVPASAAVTTYTAEQIKSMVLPYVGVKYRIPDEQAILNELAGKMVGETAPPPIPCDVDADGDLDSDDMTLFKSCKTGANQPQPLPACRSSDFDGDGDVDQTDFGVFQDCRSTKS